MSKKYCDVVPCNKEYSVEICDLDQVVVMERKIKLLSIVLLGILVTGCSYNVVKETMYNMMMSVSQQQCERESLSACPQQHSYTDYKRQRKEALK